MDTIRGGAYKLPDGSWIDANGKPIRAPKEEDLYPEREEALKNAPLVDVPPLGPEDEFETPPAMITEETGLRVGKTSRKKKS